MGSSLGPCFLTELALPQAGGFSSRSGSGIIALPLANAGEAITSASGGPAIGFDAVCRWPCITHDNVLSMRNRLAYRREGAGRSRLTGQGAGARAPQASGRGSPKLALAECEKILCGSVNQVVQFLAERSERATRLRQTSPFAGILTEAERRAIYKSYSTRTYHPGSQPNLG
jgi:hypothetical protein